jgi:hypothetical protein
MKNTNPITHFTVSRKNKLLLLFTSIVAVVVANGISVSSTVTATYLLGLISPVLPDSTFL